MATCPEPHAQKEGQGSCTPHRASFPLVGAIKLDSWNGAASPKHLVPPDRSGSPHFSVGAASCAPSSRLPELITLVRLRTMQALTRAPRRTAKTPCPCAQCPRSQLSSCAGQICPHKVALCSGNRSVPRRERFATCNMHWSWRGTDSRRRRVGHVCRGTTPLVL